MKKYYKKGMQSKEVNNADQPDKDKSHKHQEGDSDSKEGLRRPQEEEGGACHRVPQAAQAVDAGQGHIYKLSACLQICRDSLAYVGDFELGYASEHVNEPKPIGIEIKDIMGVKVPEIST